MSKEEYAVEVENISKIYTLRNKNNQYKTDKKEFYALKDVSFKVKKGDVVLIQKGRKHKITAVGDSVAIRLAVSRYDVDHVYDEKDY